MKKEVKNASRGDFIGHLFDDVTLSLSIIKRIKGSLVAYVVLKGDTVKV